jgi:hypothetical protein
MRPLPAVSPLIVALTLAFASTVLGDERAPDLFQAVAVPTQRVALKPYVVQAQPVTVDLEVLAGLMCRQEVSLDLAPMASYMGVVERVDRRSETQLTVAGRLSDVPNATFVIVVEHDAAAGLILDPGSGLQFRLGYLGDGLHIISHVDSELYGPCGNEELLTDQPEEMITSHTPTDDELVPAPPPGSTPARGCAPLTPVFDVMIVYTDVARQAAGGANAMNAECQLALEVANGAYVNSEIDARLRLVYRGEVSYDENGALEDHLFRVAGTTDGYMDEVHTIRDSYGADVVSLFVDDADGWCGLAYCLPNTAARAFNVVRWDCAVGDFSFAHEVGHNQGCAHDVDNAGTGCNAYPYSYGWRFWGDDLLRHRTIMAYAPGTRIQYFSNPDVEFEGAPTGVPIGDPDEAHNAHTINLRRSIVENHRLTRLDIWVDFAHTGAEDGSFNLPYDSVAEGVANIVVGVGASEQPSLWINAGSTVETPSIGTPMVIRACGGLVTIGN